MNQIQNITTAQPYLTILPENDQVFAASDMFLAKYMLPLFSVDLSYINPEWQGKIHLLNPTEPCDGSIGMYTEAFHNEFANENWFILQLDENNHYQWLADKHYFILEDENHPEYYENLNYSQAMLADHEQLKQDFKKNNVVISRMNAGYPDAEPSVLVNFLGGDAYYGNWCHPIEEHLQLEEFEIFNPEEDYNEAYKKIFDQNGLRYYFIASATGYEYSKHGADDILMFYQPETKRVLFTFDWT